MEEKLVTLAIHTFQKAQILKTILENEGITVYLHNVNLIQPVISAGVRVRIKESDLPAALKIIESSEFYQEELIEEEQEERQELILIPVDFSDYSTKACEIGFNLAGDSGARIVILHAFFTPLFTTSFTLTDPFPFQTATSDEAIKLMKEAREELSRFEQLVREKIARGEWPAVDFEVVFREGLPEEEISFYSKEHKPTLIIMGTRGKDQKDVDLIGSVTAEVLETTKVPLFAIPEKTPFKDLSQVKRIAFGTSFDQKDLIAVDTLFKILKNYDIEYYLFHVSHKPDTWKEIKLGGIKEYFAKQYPDLNINYELIDGNDFVLNLEKFIREYRIDMISLSTHKRNLFARLFNPSMARKMLFHTDTPILALRS